MNIIYDKTVNVRYRAFIEAIQGRAPQPGEFPLWNGARWAEFYKLITGKELAGENGSTTAEVLAWFVATHQKEYDAWLAQQYLTE